MSSGERPEVFAVVHQRNQMSSGERPEVFAVVHQRNQKRECMQGEIINDDSLKCKKKNEINELQATFKI